MIDTRSEAVVGLCDWLGALGARWGLPAEACRVHGYLYLVARPDSTEEIASALAVGPAEVEEALSWLLERRLVERCSTDSWSTSTDPWELVTRSLEDRRARELAPALDILRRSRRDAAADRIVVAQIDKLLALVDDIAAIDAQARRLSPATLRRMLWAGGRAARLFNRAFG